MRSDWELEHDVSAEIEWEPVLDAANVTVHVREGVVTLGGHVRTVAEHDAAIVAASLVAGMRALVDEIVVRPATIPPRLRDLLEHATA